MKPINIVKRIKHIESTVAPLIKWMQGNKLICSFMIIIFIERKYGKYLIGNIIYFECIWKN